MVEKLGPNDAPHPIKPLDFTRLAVFPTTPDRAPIKMHGFFTEVGLFLFLDVSEYFEQQYFNVGFLVSMDNGYGREKYTIFNKDGALIGDSPSLHVALAALHPDRHGR